MDSSDINYKIEFEGQEYTQRTYSRLSQHMIQTNANITVARVPGENAQQPDDETDVPKWDMYLTAAEINFYLAEFAVYGTPGLESASNYFKKAVTQSVENWDFMANKNNEAYYHKTYGYSPDDVSIALQAGEIDHLLAQPDFQLTGNKADDLEKIFLNMEIHFIYQPTEKEFLDQIAVHYQTGEKIPQEMIQSLVNASNFNAGYLCCRQLSFGLLDMAWHTLEQPFDGDVAAFEKKAWAPTVIMPEVPEALMGTSFGHIFSGGYAAGYYGYKWAEVLDADAFSVFKSKGIFNKEVAKSFRDNILSKGGTEDPAVLYKRFRGQEPTIDALLIRNGIKK